MLKNFVKSALTRELCEECFDACVSLSRVTFGASSSLKLIGKGAFRGSGVCEIHIPDSVEELCEGCFSECKSLESVTFGASSSLKRVGLVFDTSSIREIHIPDRLEALLSKAVLYDIEIITHHDTDANN